MRTEHDGVAQGSLGPSWSPLAAFVLGGILPAGVAVVWVPFRAGHSDVIVALVMVLATTATGATRSRAAVIGATASAAVTFIYFDTQPFDQFSIAKQPDVATAVCLVVVGLMTGEVALRMVRARRSEKYTSLLLERVRDAASLVAEGEELAVLIGVVAQGLEAIAGAQACEFSAEPLPRGVPVVDRTGRLDAPVGADLSQVGLPVWALGEVVGYFVIRSSNVPTLTPARLQVATTLADQVGAALAAQAPLPPLPPTTKSTGRGRPAPILRLRVTTAEGDVIPRWQNRAARWARETPRAG